MTWTIGRSYRTIGELHVRNGVKVGDLCLPGITQPAGDLRLRYVIADALLVQSGMVTDRYGTRGLRS